MPHTIEWYCTKCKEVMFVYIVHLGSDTHYVLYYHCAECHNIIAKFRKKKEYCNYEKYKRQ